MPRRLCKPAGLLATDAENRKTQEAMAARIAKKTRTQKTETAPAANRIACQNSAGMPEGS